MEKQVCAVIENALGLKAGSVSLNDGMNTIKQWDSLGFLSILSALEQKFGNRVAKIDALSSATSVRAIIAVFKKEGIGPK